MPRGNRPITLKASVPKPNLGGLAKGTQLPVKPVDLDLAVEIAADRILTGGKLTPLKIPNPPSKAELGRLSRALGCSIEEFNQRLAEKLAVLSDKISNRIEEKIDADEFKPGELGFIFSVTEDKRRALDARAQLGNAHVNIQVNHYGDKTREEILADLRNPTVDTPPDPNPADFRPEDVI